LTEALEQKLAAGIGKSGLSLPHAVPQQLARYLRLLEKWNKVFNLTAVREPEDMVAAHVLDSLAVLPHLVGRTIIDVGSGAGLPGIPIALAAPALKVSLLDSNHKKTRFLIQALADLELENAEVIKSRAEDYTPHEGFDTVLCRAFGSLGEFVSAASHLCAPGGKLLAMKGRDPTEELNALPLGFRALEISRLSPPDVEGERCLVAIGAETAV
jgi:16S rRNA (guanine527-N7)-methyltransferase